MLSNDRDAMQNPMANMDMAAFPGRTYRYLQVCLRSCSTHSGLVHPHEMFWCHFSQVHP